MLLLWMTQVVVGVMVARVMVAIIVIMMAVIVMMMWWCSIPSAVSSLMLTSSLAH
jgi:hypothetical protein